MEIAKYRRLSTNVLYPQHKKIKQRVYLETAEGNWKQRSYNHIITDNFSKTRSINKNDTA